ncbi:unnamed protein product [Paramecium pentaurelia]|uniref:CAF1B/HIR1 beta-propeller domain-containing protein n=1 Tax=Paramecium pentaurelia TaxID=43138 RepID=A0A8S1X982_9CILI|nr:unnamed protein product [Paramecium pentaurelia]
MPLFKRRKLQLTSLVIQIMQMTKSLVSFQKNQERKKFKTSLDIFQITGIKANQNNVSYKKERISPRLIKNRNCLLLEMISNKSQKSQENQKTMTSISQIIPLNQKKNLNKVQLIASRIIEGSFIFCNCQFQLTSIDETFIKGGSNSLHILVKIKVDLRNNNFENIKIYNTSLVGANFVRCNFGGSQFKNVNISGIYVNGALLLNCKWTDLKILELNQLHGHSDYVRSVCFSLDGKTLASGGGDCSIRLWDVKTGQQKAQLECHTSYVQSVCFSPDGNTLASGSDNGSVLLWNAKTRKKRAKLDGQDDAVISVCFSFDGKTLASGGGDCSIRLWNVKTGQQKAKLDGHTYWVQSVSSGSLDQSIRFWDVKTGQQKAQLDGHDDAVISVFFSFDGKTLASGGGDCSIRLWDVETGQQKAQLEGHTSIVYSVCFSPDGNTLASGSFDNSICLWDVKTGQQKAKLDGHTYWVQSVCFSPDGNTLASGSDDKSIRLWDVKNGKEISSNENQYQDILAQFKAPLFQSNPLPESNNITILRISQTPLFQSQAAIILKGDFVNDEGYDIRQLLISKGCSILEDLNQK